jgi:hypothetical protein
VELNCSLGSVLMSKGSGSTGTFPFAHALILSVVLWLQIELASKTIPGLRM